MHHPRTLAELLLSTAAAYPAHGLTYVEGERARVRVTFPSLLEQARTLLAALRAVGVRKGEHVVISVALPRTFLPLYWACQLGGLVAVPVAPLQAAKDRADALRIEGICRTLGSPIVVCDPIVGDALQTDLGRAGIDARVVAADSLQREPGGSGELDPGAPDDVAMIQFSSGSTRDPKGVCLRHRNLISNCVQMTDRAALGSDDVEAGWMPLFHDMGLIGCHVAMTMVGADQVKIPTLAFLEAPISWLEVATRARATLLSGTNTALRLLMRRVTPQQAARFDLRTVRNFLIGAEPVFPSVLRSTQEFLSPAGLRHTALRVAYGLAECCVGVGFDSAEHTFTSRVVSRKGLGERTLRAPEHPGDAYEVADVGLPYDGCEVRIVDDDDRAVGDGVVGHLQVRGPQVMAGYFQDEAATRAAFCGEWLRTGDLGYLMRGSFGICGRAKETLIIAGRNVFASDVESLAAEVQGVQSAVVAPVEDAEAETECAAMFVVLSDPESPQAPQVLEAARRKVQGAARLPIGWIVPVRNREIPRTSSGKVRRLLMAERLRRGEYDDRVLRVPAPAPHPREERTADELQTRLREAWAGVLRMPAEAIGLDDAFLELGGSSVAAVEMLGLIEAELGTKLGQDLLIDCSTVRQMATWIRARRGQHPDPVTVPAGTDRDRSPIAIVALACRLPGADDPESFFESLMAGTSQVGPVPSGRMGPAGLSRFAIARGAFLADPYAFDPTYFGISEAEALVIDPQQRLMLEIAAEALESAGLGAPRRRDLRIGTFLGVSATPYRNAVPSPTRAEEIATALRGLPAFQGLPVEVRERLRHELAERARTEVIAPSALVGNLLNMVAARLSHAFDLTGPSIVVDTACSSSLVAIHLACQALRSGECDAAIAGGIHLGLDADVWHFLHSAGALSSSGSCKPFGQDADGIVLGEGAALVVLRRREDAVRWGDPVRGWILGSAIGSDGRALSPMAPNPRGQRSTLMAAYRDAGIAPQSISAIEAHGTGTVIGDPIEIGVLNEVFDGAKEGGIAFGSVKSNLGHLLAGAGVAGLLKMVLALEKRELPPTLHADPPNPRLALAGSPLRIAHQAVELGGPAPLRGSVSAFGFGGTNAHVILERSEPGADTASDPVAVAVPLSAPTADHLRDWARALSTHATDAVALARELGRGRTAFATRAAAVFRKGQDAIAALDSLAAGDDRGWLLGAADSGSGPGQAVLLFPGQGAQALHQARGLVEAWPGFGSSFRTLLAAAGTEEDLFSACYGEAATDEVLRRTDLAQPLLVAFQIALARFIIDCHVSVAGVVGHSVGEISAAAIAGVIEDEVAVRWAAERGRLMQRCQPGAMIAVAAGADVVAPFLAGEEQSLSIAAINAHDQTVVAGDDPRLSGLARRLDHQGIGVVRIPVQHGFHSPLMRPILEDLERAARDIVFSAPRVPMASTLLGRLLAPGDMNHAYWRDHALLTVRFEEALRVIAGELPAATRAGWFLEIGPGTTLSRLGRRILGRGDGRTIVSLCRTAAARDDEADLAQGLTALASGWVAGSNLDWSRVQPFAPGKHVDIPCIPFRRKHLRIDTPPVPSAARLLHRVVWEELSLDEPRHLPSDTWIVAGAGQSIVRAMRQAGCKAIEVYAGTAFERLSADECRFDASDPAQWVEAQEAFCRGSATARWVVVSPADSELSIRWIHACAAAAPLTSNRPSLWVVADASALGQEACAVVATFAGAAVEELGARGRCVEVAGPLDVGLSTSIVEELGRPGPSRIRLDGCRRAPKVVSADLEAAGEPAPFARTGGNYLIIGGTGGIGSLIARRVAAQGGNVILASRRTEGVESLLGDLRSTGVHASHLVVDVQSESSVKAAVARALEEYGSLHGVVFGAGIASGSPLSLTEPSETSHAIRTKATGAANLERALDGLTVDWVALLSSICAILPALGRGLASYAAANAALDSIASRKRAGGAPWTSLSFGMWRGVGMGNRPGLLDAVQHAGGRSLEPEEALDALELGVRAGVAHVVVADPDDRRVLPPANPRVESGAPKAAPSRTTAALTASQSGSSDESLESYLRRRLGQATGLEPAGIDPHAPFPSLGLDSLASVEIARELEKRLGRTLTPTVLFENDTLARLLAALGKARAPAPAAPTRKELPGVFPLMPAQATFLAQQEFHPEIPSYVFLRIDLEGDARAASFNQALRALALRHGMLRVVFDWADGKPVHRIVDCEPPAVEVLDLKTTADEADSELARIEHTFRNRTFDLAAAPAWRVALVQRSPRRSSLLFSAHHILFDAWSAQLFLTELLEGHEAFRRGVLPAWKPVASTFADCVDAYRKAQQGNDETRAFWAEELRDAPTDLRLPFDGDPAALPVGPCGLVETRLGDDATARLEGLARSWSVSVFHIIFASYLACLRRWTGTDDVPIRVAQARREGHVQDVDAVLGSFADSLPVRVVEPTGTDIQAIAQGVKSRMLEVQKHAAISSLAIANLHGHRSSGGPRGVTPAGLSFPAFPTPTRIGDLCITGLRGGAVSGFTQLGLIAYRSCNSLHFSWNFHETLFAPQTVARLAAEHLRLVEGLLHDAATPGEPEYDPPARTQPRRELLLQDKVVDAIERAPDRIAVGGDEPMTYGELGRRSAALCAALVEEGLGAGDLVAVLGHPQAKSIAGVLGVLRSGAGYLPLDPAYPRQRIAEVIAHARARTLVTTAALLPLLEQARSSLDRVLLLDEAVPGEDHQGTIVPWSAIRSLAPRAPRRQASSESIAYVMYTSGTTGHPKGVVVAHRAVASFHSWVERAFRVTSEDRFIPTSSLAFGASLRQVFSPLMAGGRVVPAPPELIRDPFALAGFLDEQGITFWNSVPTLWGALLDAIDQRDGEGVETRLQALRYVLIGGEDLPATLVRRWIDRFGARHRIFNLFGCAETIVNSVVYEIKGRPGEKETTIPIGMARPGTTALVLDADGRPCRAGEVGILHIGGEALAEGYLHEPELTRAAFPTTRWGRVYRTGDLARRDDRGVITYLGRGDDRVKIRGNRVELAEIEGTLRNHPSVRDAACVAFARGDRQWLVAFVITAASQDGWEASLREWLTLQLPVYMVPHRFLTVDRFPLNANGKIDRRALIERLGPALTLSEEAGKTSPTESILLEIWKEVLGNPSIDRDLDFFEAGGDSILAIEMFRRLRGRVPVTPRPVAIYAARTVAKLALAIDEMAKRGVGTAEAAPTQKEQSARGEPTSFPLSPAQTGFLFLQQGGAEDAPVWFADIPVEGDLDPQRFTEAMLAVARRHPMLRTAFAREENGWRQQVLEQLRIPVEVIDSLQGSDDLDALWSSVRSTRFELGRPPLFRTVIARTGPRSWRCMMAVHHIIGDAWSLRLVLQDLAAAYAGQELPALRASYADVVAWHAGHDSHRKESADWWREFFLREASPARLPAAAGDRLADTIAVEIGEPTTQRLRRIARARSTTLHSCVLTLWLSCLREVAGVEDLTVGTASSGRDIPVADAGSIVGCLATTLPVRTLITGDFDRDLRAVAAAWEQAYAHGDVPVYEAWLSAGAPREPSVPGMGLYFSYMEFKPLAQAQDAPLRFGLSGARLHFAAESAEHEAMLTVLVDDTLRLQLRGTASASCLRDLLARMDRALEHLAWDSQTPPATKTLDDAAIVAYLPSLATLADASPGIDPACLRTLVLQRLFPRGAPRWLESRDTALGRTGAVFLPMFADDLPAIAHELLAAQASSAVRIATDRGARAVSLAGVLPSLTSYGHAVARLLPAGSASVVTTGHAATVAAVVGTLRKAMAALRRSWAGQRVAVVGFGSMGQGIASLMIAALGRPASLVVCDREEALASVEGAARELQNAFGSAITLVGAAPTGLPDSVYACDVIVGATNRGGVLDVTRMKDGAVLADDSFPPIYDRAQVGREVFEIRRVLVLGAGRLALEGEVSGSEALGLEPALESLANRSVQETGAAGMPGCRVEALLVAQHGLKPLTGLVTGRQAMHAWELLARLGVEAAPLHVGSRLIPEEVVETVGRLARE